MSKLARFGKQALVPCGVRLATVSLALAASSFAMADRLINIPTGGKIPYGVVRGEYMFEYSRSRTAEAFLGIGIGKSFDMTLRSERFEQNNAIGTFDISYNYIAPVTDFAPGISAGILDALDESRDGRRLFLAITFRQTVTGSLNQDVPMDLTLGFTYGSVDAAFLGLVLPFTDRFRLLTEHNGRRLTAGFEYRPLEALGLRLLFRERDTLISIQAGTRF